jgi:hypothetical protein
MAFLSWIFSTDHVAFLYPVNGYTAIPSPRRRTVKHLP